MSTIPDAPETPAPLPVPEGVPSTDDRPTGPFAAGLLAAGIACAVFGLSIIAVEASTMVEKAMTLSEPVGTLSGKAVTATVVYALAWLILHLALRHRRPDLNRVIRITAVLTAIGLLSAFPPFYMIVTGHPLPF